MAVYYPAGCDVLVPDHVCDPCEAREKGRVSSVAYVRNSYVFTDPTDPTEWQTGINSGDIQVIPQVNGSFDGGAEVETPGYGRQSTTLTGFNYSLTYKDPDYKTNGVFYNALKNSRDYRFAFVTETQAHLTDAAVTAIPKNPIADDPTSEVVWEVTVKWASGDLLEPFDVPPGIFDRCFSVAS
jgi:hypothetical protein